MKTGRKPCARSECIEALKRQLLTPAGSPNACLGYITGQSTVGITLTSGSTSLSTFANAWSAGKLIGLASYVGPPSPSVVGNHAYAVVGFDSATSTLTLFNPWGIQYGLLTMTWSEVQANFQYFDRTA